MMTVRQASHLIDWVIAGLIVIGGLLYFFGPASLRTDEVIVIWLDHPCANWVSNRAAPFTVNERNQAMLNPLKWERVDQWRLFFAIAFGAALGFFNTGSGGLWFNILCAFIGAVLVGGWFYYYRAFR